MQKVKKILIKLHGWLAWIGVNNACIIALIEVIKRAGEELQVIFLIFYLLFLPCSVLYVLLINSYLSSFESEPEAKEVFAAKDPLENYYKNFF